MAGGELVSCTDAEAAADRGLTSEEYERLQRITKRVIAALFFEPLDDDEVFSVLLTVIINMIDSQPESEAERLRTGMTFIELFAAGLRDTIPEAPQTEE